MVKKSPVIINGALFVVVAHGHNANVAQRFIFALFHSSNAESGTVTVSRMR